MAAYGRPVACYGVAGLLSAYGVLVIRYRADCLAWPFDRQKKTRSMPGLVCAAVYSSMARENISALKPIAPIRLTVNAGASSSCIVRPRL